MISVCLQEDHFEQLLDTTSEPPVCILFCSAGLPAVAATLLCVCNTLSSCCSFCDRLQRQLCEAAALPPLVLSMHCTVDYIHCLLPWLSAPMCYNVLCAAGASMLCAMFCILGANAAHCLRISANGLRMQPARPLSLARIICQPRLLIISLPCSHYLSHRFADYFSPLLALFFRGNC